MITGTAVPDQLGIFDPALAYTVSPTGGIIVLEPTSAADFATWTLERFVAVSGVAASGVTLFTGQAGQSPTQVYADYGDGVNAPLDPTQEFIYRFTTGNGVAETPALSPACSIVLEPDWVSALLYRALQSGITALKLPAGFNNAPKVMHAMPLAGEGTPYLPSVFFNETFLQQEDFQIGEDVNTDWQVNEYQIASNALRHYTIFIVAASPREREYYKDAVIGIYNSILGPILHKIGNNASHRFQCSSSQLVGRANEPGFYFSEVLLQFTGLYAVGVKTSYGPIDHIAFVLGEDDAYI